MPNAVLESFRRSARRADRHDGRHLGPSRRPRFGRRRKGPLEAARQRIAALDEQINPLAEFETLRAAHADALGQLPIRPEVMPAGRRLDAGERAPAYPSAGAFLVDYLRAHGIAERGVIDEQAAARVRQARALDNQTTTDTPGILPTPIVGSVVNLIDSNRPLISSLGGAMALGGIPGKSFTRPRITPAHPGRPAGGGEDRAGLAEHDNRPGGVHQVDVWRNGRHFPPGHRLDLAGGVGHSRPGSGRRVRHPDRDGGGDRLQDRGDRCGRAGGRRTRWPAWAKALYTAAADSY